MGKSSRKVVQKAPWAEGLTVKEARFVEAYRATLDRVQAAKKAGVQDRSARQMACKWMSEPRVLRAIDLAFADSPGITRSTLADICAKIATAKNEDFVERDPVTGRLRLKDGVLDGSGKIDSTAIQEVRITKKGGGVKLKLYDRHRSIELLGKALGLNKERPIAPDDGTVPLSSDAELARKLAFLLQRGAQASEGESR